jgi:hypothetical protein
VPRRSDQGFDGLCGAFQIREWQARGDIMIGPQKQHMIAKTIE